MKRKYMLSFPESTGDKPVVCELVRRYDICVNIIQASISPAMAGTMLAELDACAEELTQAVEFLAGRGVGVELLTDKIALREDGCLQCGNCVLACFSGALTIGAPDWKLAFDRDRCVLCRACITACPRGLFGIAAE